MTDRPGLAVGDQFYPFSDHFRSRRTAPQHALATDDRIRSILSQPDFTEIQSGNRQVFWRRFPERNWWIKAVLAYNTDGSATILTAYEDTTRGQAKWNALR